jgi:hypothetical protein
MQAAGDIIIRNAANVTTRLGIGARGTVLKSQGTGQAPAWQPVQVRNVYAGGAVRIIADRDGLGAVKTDGVCTITNNVGAKISRIEIDINELNNGDLDNSGNYVVIFGSGNDNFNNNQLPKVTIIDRSNTAIDGDAPTDATPFLQYVADEASTSGIRARITGWDRVKILGLLNTVNWGTIVVSF